MTVIVGIVCFIVGTEVESYLWKKGRAKLRALVKEMAECIFNNPCTGCSSYSCAECTHRREMDSLVARANDEWKNEEL